MSAWRRLFRRRPYALAAAGVLAFLVSGDRALIAPPPGVGIDPFEVLDQQVRNNVLIVFDTSGSMKWPVDRDNFTLGGDDPGSRMYQAKQAVKAVVAANQSRVNFGIVSYNALATDKTINQNQNYEGDGRFDGPFIYVSADANAAGFYNVFSNPEDVTTGEVEACNSVDGYFCRISNTFANYDGNGSADVWRSFMNRNGGNQANAYNNAYPQGCVNGAGQLSPMDLANPAAMRCRYYMQSRLLRNGVRYTWDMANNLAVGSKLLRTTNITCPAPPAGLLGHSFTPPCVQMQAGNNGPISTFYYSSAIYQQQVGDSCGGGALLAPVARCDGNNAPQVLAQMDPELPVTPAGTLNGVPNFPGNPTFDYFDGHLDGDQTLPAFGLRADQATPLAGTLDFIRTVTNPSPAFPAQAVPSQRNFVILVTDGDDTCADGNPDRAAVLAAVAAERLYRTFDPQSGSGDFQHWAETLVVGFASGVSAARLNVIAQGGSGAIINTGSSDPSTAATCPAGVQCRNAFFASSTDELIRILTAALEVASVPGVFSGTPSVFDGVPEYVATLAAPSPSPTFSVMDPETRYDAAAFRSYRALFDAQGFRGIVRGFDDQGPMLAGSQYRRNWEAGQRMMDPDRLSSDLDPASGTGHTFQGLLGGGSAPMPGGVTHIARRIFTTRRNGRQLGSPDDPPGTGFCSGGCRVDLWPPSSGVVVVPDNDYTAAGSLDAALFRKADGTQMTLADLQALPLKACVGANLPGACATSPLTAARKEAREMILAFTAGAEARRDSLGNPLRNTAGQILYQRRAWLLSESTIGSPALVTPPITIAPTVATPEYILYRDGPRDDSGKAPVSTDAYLRQGFGLRNPDKDGKEQPAGTLSRPGLKPEMSVVYVPGNDMLHAFRAGPCPGADPGDPTIPDVASCADETGGEELFAFVPYDLLPKLKERMKPQTRQDHTFMISTSLRFADVFMPGSFSLSVPNRAEPYSLTGRWRRLLLFGRGIGGKYYTSLDITGLGSLTNPALQTNLPVVLWNRGNPDSQDGLLTGTRVGTNTEWNLYLDMGMTWSTPAIVRAPVGRGVGFVAYVGSGYSTGDPREGTRFYTLDPFTGDILASADVGEGAQPAFQNALVANPVTFAPERLVAGVDLPHPASPVNESVFIGDIHGRLWKFKSNAPATPLLFRDLGIDQPVGVAAALLNLGDPYVFVETGSDARVPAPVTGFRMFGFKDTRTVPYPSGVVTLPLSPPDFGLEFPAPPPPGKGDFRGTLQPVTAFRGTSAGGEGIVFFSGTRFNPPDASCLSSFDTIIFGLSALTGNVAYDTTVYTGAKAVGLPRPPVPPGAGGAPPFDQGTPQQGQEPGTAPTKPGKVGTPAVVKAEVIRPGSSVCR